MPSAKIWITCACALLLAGCAQSTDGSPVAERSAGAGVVPAGLEAFYNQTLTWEPCGDYAQNEYARTAYESDLLDCAEVSVPVDYNDPGGAAAAIAIMRKKATGSKIGSLLVNPGGPGASGLDFAAGLSEGFGESTLGERFDLIGFDPRGIGASTPQIRCRTDAEIDDLRDDPIIPNTPDGIAQSEQREKDYAAECVDKLGADFLAHVGTREVVRDMDVIRSVLGDEKVNYLGISYGTRIGSAYAETFPANVRALVLDGAVDPAENVIDKVTKQHQGFQQAFDAFAADCATRPACPLGDAPELAVEKFRSLVDPLLDKPARTSDSRSLVYDDAMTGTFQALYSQELWKPLRTGLQELVDGRGDTLLNLADLYLGRSDDGTYSNLNDANTAIRCVDGPHRTDRAEVAEADRRIREVAPFADNGMGTGAAPLGTCAFWPVPNSDEPHTIVAPGLAKVVVVSTTGDPATPYQAGVVLAEQLKGSLITYEGTQHGATFSGVSCVDDAIANYLIDLTVPTEGLRCASD